MPTIGTERAGLVVVNGSPIHFAVKRQLAFNLFRALELFVLCPQTPSFLLNAKHLMLNVEHYLVNDLEFFIDICLFAGLRHLPEHSKSSKGCGNSGRDFQAVNLLKDVQASP